MSGFADDEIAGRVLEGFQALLLGNAPDVFASGVFLGGSGG
jgi:hypothetical protein